MDWTQAELAQRVGYSVATIRKLERDELRPSKHLAELLAQGLDVALTQHPSFVSFARSTPTAPVQPDAQPIHAHRRSNLPAQLTPFFGRTAEIVELTQHLDNPIARLITIVGPGGMGKTRLALAIAQSMLDAQTQADSTGNPTSNIKHQTYADGVYFVALAPIRAPEHIVSAIAEAIDLRFQADSRPPKQQLLDYLQHKQLLLVLDNFEHLQAGAELVLELLQACPGLRMLVTSREQLQLNSETLFVLESMALPAAASLPDVLSYSAVQLFVETARRVRPKFTPTAANAQAIVRICQLVGGMPLGIILAAAWVEVLSPNEIVIELSQGFDFLKSELRDLPERQRSMRAVLAQSWQRLTEAERTVFMRLAVFRGGFTRMAAQHVAGASVRMLSSFVNKSLVQCEPNRRYTMHEFLRQFAEAELEAAKQTADAVRRTHALYYLAMAEQGEPLLATSDQQVWLDWLEQNHDNLRAALAWAADHNAASALRLSGALTDFWHMRGHLSEGRHWLERALTVADTQVNHNAEIGGPSGAVPPIAARVKALHGAAMLAHSQEDDVHAEALYTASLPLAQALGDRGRVAILLNDLGGMALHRGDTQRAMTLHLDALALARTLGDQRAIAQLLDGLGNASLTAGDLGAATVYLGECLEILQNLDDRCGVAWALHGLGLVARASGADDRALELFTEALAFARAVNDRGNMARLLYALGCVILQIHDLAGAATRFGQGARLSHDLGLQQGVALNLDGLATVRIQQCALAQAARLLSVADMQWKRATFSYWRAADRTKHEQTVAFVCAQFDAATFAAAWAAGQAMTLDEAVAYALVDPASTSDG